MFELLLSIVFPERCASCGKSGTALCDACAETLRPSLPISEPSGSFALFDYQQPLVQKAIWELKYHRKGALARKLAERGTLSAQRHARSLLALQEEPAMPIVLVPAPQHFTRTYARGFNQSKLIAHWLKRALPQAAIRPLLKKIRATDAQAHAHTRQERQMNLAHTMQATAALGPHALYIVVDDVITTGSTIAEASRALRAAGAKHVGAIALAHGYAARKPSR